MPRPSSHDPRYARPMTRPETSLRVGVEVGGTFTDLVAFEGEEITVTKVPSTPRSPDLGAFASLEQGAIELARITDLAHGSTVATNAVLERKGARTAFVTTGGFRDILFLQRHDRRSIYDLRYQKPAPVVARRDCFEVSERMLADGTVAAPLDEDRVVNELIPRIEGGGYQAIALCLLNAYANPAHEARVAALLAARLPGVSVTLSSDVARVFREYERASTTSLSAFVQPVIERYLGRFDARLAEAGFRGRLTVMQSNGGRLPAAAMRKSAITALFSGPAAGVIGATRQAERSGFSDLITFDMGGTSSDVCLVQDGRPTLTTETEIDGLPVQTPMLDIVTVGGGGGSIGWVDDGGMLRVGPQSAGAEPGPACYGFGGTEPTVTDAQVIRGAVRPEAFLGGRMAIDADKSRAAFAPIADRFGMTIDAAAESVVGLVDANIVRAVQLVTTERGRDPRDYALVPFGGAGPLHAAAIAENLGIETICVPPNAGVISAFGLLASDYLRHASITRKMPLDEGPTTGVRLFGRLRDELAVAFAEMGLDAEALRYAYEADMRFVGQAFELAVDLAPERIEALSRDDFLAGFEDAHQRMFYHGIGAGRAVEIVSLRVGATLSAGAVPTLKSAPSVRAPAVQKLFSGGRWRDCRHLASDGLGAGDSLAGPAIVEGSTATTYVPDGWRGAVDGAGNLIMRREP